MGTREDFRKWWKESGIEFASIFESGAARKGWNARQPEIDALKAELNHVYYLLRGRTPAQCDLLTAENLKLKTAMKGRLSVDHAMLFDVNGNGVGLMLGKEEVFRPNALRMAVCWNEHDDLVAERDALKDSLHRSDIDASKFHQQSIDRASEIRELKAENEKLRKAAGPALELIEGLEPILGDKNKRNPVLDNLRAALEETPTPSSTDKPYPD